MEKVTINWRDELIKLFPETTTREIPEGAVICNTCGGIGLRAENSKIIVGCLGCGGKGYKPLCECGAVLSGSFTKVGDKCQGCKTEERRLKCSQIVDDRFQRATKIPITEYKGFILHNDTAEEPEAVLEYIMDEAPEDRPEYVWGTNAQEPLLFDIRDVLRDKCEGGYEDMENRVNLDSSILSAVNELLDQWRKEQGESAKVYYEDWTMALLITKDAVNLE